MDPVQPPAKIDRRLHERGSNAITVPSSGEQVRGQFRIAPIASFRIVTSYHLMSYGEKSEAEQRQATLRIVDANANRAAEGLRVVEEYCRFALEDAHLARSCKLLRHDLTEALRAVELRTAGDRARHVMRRGNRQLTTSGKSGPKLVSFRSARSRLPMQNGSSRRCGRSKNTSKLLSAAGAARVEALRYQWYTLEKALVITAASPGATRRARLYVLIDGSLTEDTFASRVKSLISGGVHLLQLRDKQLDDRTLLARARLLRRLIDESPSKPLLIINDRPDIAVLCRADGVHVGQEELSRPRCAADRRPPNARRRLDALDRASAAGRARRRQLPRLRPDVSLRNQAIRSVSWTRFPPRSRRRDLAARVRHRRHHAREPARRPGHRVFPRGRRVVRLHRQTSRKRAPTAGCSGHAHAA